MKIKNKNLNQKIFVAGHNGMVGSAILRKLMSEGYTNILTIEKKDLNLFDTNKVFEFLKNEMPENIFLAAAKVGGIYTNDMLQAEFLYNNLMIQNNVIMGAASAGLKNLFFLGSSCIYPKESYQPIKEEYLLTGPLEKTNEGYSIAKIAGIKLCESCNKQYGTNFCSIMPTNLYGPNDNYNLLTSHVLPAIIRKVHEAKQQNCNHIVLWGSGKPKRDLLYVDDLAEACLFLMENGISDGIYNVGSGEERSIVEIAKIVMKIVDYEIKIKFDKSKPEGTQRKLLDTTKIKKLGWKPRIEFETGVKLTYDHYLKKLKMS